MPVLHLSAERGRQATYVAKLIVSALILVLILRHIDLAATTTAAASVSPLALAAALALQLASNCVAAGRWHLIMNRIGVEAPFIVYLRSFFKGAFFNQGLPASIGGDGMRILDATRLADNKEDAFFGVFIDRIIGLAGLLLLNIGALLLDPGLLPEQIRLALLALMTMLLAGLIGLFFLHRAPFFMRATPLGYLGRLSVRYRQVYSSPGAIGLQTGLSVLTHLLGMGVFACLGGGVGLHYPLTVYLALVPPVVLLTIVPISLAGWGVREGGLIGLFLLIGADRGLVLSFSLLYGLVNLTAALPGFAVYLTQRHRL